MEMQVQKISVVIQGNWVEVQKCGDAGNQGANLVIVVEML